MQEPLKSLIALGVVGQRILRVTRDRNALEVDVRRQQETIAALQARLEEAQQGILACKKEADSRELKIKGLEEDIRKFQMQLNSIKNQRDFDAMKLQIKEKEQGIRALEDEELEALTRLDEQKGVVEDLKRRIQEENERLARIRHDVDEQVRKYGSELAALEAERDGLRANVDPQILINYDRLSTSRDNPLVSVRNRVCQGCHTLVPMQILNEVMRRDRIVHCHSCGRLLYIEEDE